MPTTMSTGSQDAVRASTGPEVEVLDHIYLNKDIEKNKAAEPKRGGKSSAKSWTQDEDMLLCRAFCTISSDPIVGAQQSSDGFWRRITLYYNENAQAQNFIERSMESAKSHFYAFHGDCLKFNASINRFRADQRSGENDAIVLQNALMEWNSDGKKKGAFKWLHCWEILKNSPKFQGPSTTSRGGKKSKTSEFGDHTSGSGQDLEQVFDDGERYVRRPIGQKAAKAGKRKVKCGMGSNTDQKAERMLEVFGHIKDIHEKQQVELKKLVRMESWKTYREMLKEDTSAMTEEELEAHYALFAELKEELGLN
ncbi:Unknown protein [Striga hermonthica]|uniref:No apical meristem-associated C-terminal domain-containing protein n=1 Tax=Striga hermonthica TaxID=68872 RepID=A0A9N7NHP3_STRHE|nr:Unknown protein [Striga hermonthica]